jgi:transcriptional regulator with XRE-family HTH domain
MAKQRQRAVLMENIGERILQLCSAHGLSKRDVERIAGLSRQHLHRIIVGRVRSPHSRTILRIARVLGVGPLTADRARIEEWGELRP